MASGVTIQGEAELLRRMAKLRKPIGAKVLWTAVKSGGEIVRKRGKAKAPRRTGLLKKEIKVRKSWVNPPDHNRAEAIVGWQASKASRTPAFYGRFLEYGTRERVHKSGKSVGSIRPKAFMKPALHAEKVNVKNTIGRVLKSEVLRRARG
mgnify:FL=1